MVPPFISYVTFNRLGLTVKSLSAILRDTEDFELHIIDSYSRDDTWDYIMSLSDPRIRSRERLEINHGKTYAVNLHLFTRRPEQYFFTVDNDVCIETAGWIGRFLNIFNAFPETGLLGVRAGDGYLPQVNPRSVGAITYQELSDNLADVDKNYIPDYCMGLSPALIHEIGYFCEENYHGEKDLTYRACNFTRYKAGFVTDVSIQVLRSVGCEECAYTDRCRLDKAANTCFTKYDKTNRTEEFLRNNKWRFEETMRDMKSGARPAYCGSILDTASTSEHLYNRDWAMENFLYFIKNAN